MTATVTDVDRTWTSADLTGRWPGHSHRPRVVLHRLRRHLGYATVGSGRPQLWTVPEIAAVATYLHVITHIPRAPAATLAARAVHDAAARNRRPRWCLIVDRTATCHDNPADLAAIILTCPAAMVVPLDSVWRTIP